MEKILICLVSISFLATSFAQKPTEELFPAINPVFHIPSDELASDEIFFTAEIFTGSNKKYELRTATGSVINDRKLCPRKVLGKDETVLEYPSNYGISPGRFNVDGDPLDLVVIGSGKKYQEMIEGNQVKAQKVRVIGIVKMDECELDRACAEDEWVQDWKVLAVDLNDPKYQNIQSADELTEIKKQELANFYGNYHGTKVDAAGVEYPLTRVTAITAKKEGLEFVNQFQPQDPAIRQAEVNKCNTLYKELLTQKEEIIKKNTIESNKEFVSCMFRVWSKDFFKTKEDVDFLLRFGAAQILATKLKKEGITYENSLSKMQELRDKKELHYRFVSHDAGKEGTGNPVYEWVKTKNRNRGCPAGTAPQHYEADPLVNLLDLEFGEECNCKK